MRKYKPDELCEVTVAIPKKILIESVNDRHPPFYKKTFAQQYVDHLVGRAIMSQYYKLMMGGDSNG